MKLTINGKQYRAVPRSKTTQKSRWRRWNLSRLFIFMFCGNVRLHENEIRPQIKGEKHAYIAFWL